VTIDPFALVCIIKTASSAPTSQAGDQWRTWTKRLRQSVCISVSEFHLISPESANDKFVGINSVLSHFARARIERRNTDKRAPQFEADAENSAAPGQREQVDEGED
jgi:hypothetical protein